MIRTSRLILREWREEDLEPFAEMNADPIVMEHFPSTLTKEESDGLAHRSQNTIIECGYSLFAATFEDQFIGFIGLAAPKFEAHFTPCVEIGWRLARPFWGKGFATEGAKACLEFGFNKVGLEEIISFTALCNTRSIAVMERLGMHRNPDDDFDHPSLKQGHPLLRHVLYRLKR